MVFLCVPSLLEGSRKHTLTHSHKYIRQSDSPQFRWLSSISFRSVRFSFSSSMRTTIASVHGQTHVYTSSRLCIVYIFLIIIKWTVQKTQTHRTLNNFLCINNGMYWIQHVKIEWNGQGPWDRKRKQKGFQLHKNVFSTFSVARSSVYVCFHISTSFWTILTALRTVIPKWFWYTLNVHMYRHRQFGILDVMVESKDLFLLFWFFGCFSDEFFTNMHITNVHRERFVF